MTILFPESRLFATAAILLLLVFSAFAQDSLIVEDFENGFPEGWTLLNGGNSNDTWFISDEPTGSLNTNYMRCDSRAAGSGGTHLDESLITPSFDASGYAFIYLSLDTRFNNQTLDHGSIEISLDGGDTWTVMVDWSYDYSNYPYVRNITDHCEGETDVQLRFHYDDEGLWGWYWGIDNIVVKGYALDEAGPVIEVIDYPLNIMDRNTIPITAEVSDNFGLEDVTLNYGFWNYEQNRIISRRILEMTETTLPDQYFAEIDTNFTDALGTVAFYITADDTAGNSSRFPASEDDYLYVFVHDDSASYRVYHEVDFKWFQQPEEPEEPEIICADNDICDFISFGAIGSSFEWFNEHYWGMYVCSNGFISFEDESTTPIPQYFPNIEGPNSTIALFMADLAGHFYGGEIKYWIADSRYVVIEFENVHRINEIFASLTAQLILDFETDYVYLSYASFMHQILEGEYVIGFEGPRGEIGEIIYSDQTSNQPQDSTTIMIHVPSGILEGVLTDHVTGEVIADAFVGVATADSVDILYDTRTDGNGYYKLYAQPGLLDVYYEAVLTDTFSRSQENITVVYDSLTMVDTVLPESVAIIENNVTAAENSLPVAEARIECYADYPEANFLHLLTDENGFCSHVMYPGQYTFECWVPYYTEAIQYDVIFAADSTTTLEWVLQPGAAVKVEAQFPLEYELFQNYPNPFNPATNIKFNLKNPQDVKLSVFDMLGREVYVLVNESMQAGSHEIEFDASTLSSGLYFYKIESAEFRDIKKMILVK